MDKYTSQSKMWIHPTTTERWFIVLFAYLVNKIDTLHSTRNLFHDALPKAMWRSVGKTNLKSLFDTFDQKIDLPTMSDVWTIRAQLWLDDWRLTKLEAEDVFCTSVEPGSSANSDHWQIKECKDLNDWIHFKILLITTQTTRFGWATSIWIMVINSLHRCNSPPHK